MLYVFYGNDTDKARARARGVLSVMKEKRPDAEFYRITLDNFEKPFFESLIGSAGLFERKCIVFADGLLENAEMKEWISDHIGELSESENAFVFLDVKIESSLAKVMEKHANECKRFESKNSDWKNLREYNVFALSDALGRRDKAKLWSLFVEATSEGVSAEEISGVLFWQVKSMITASKSISALEAGLKPFVYSKSRSFAGSYKKEELEGLSRELVSMYHDAHRGLRDFSIALEKFTLSI